MWCCCMIVNENDYLVMHCAVNSFDANDFDSDYRANCYAANNDPIHSIGIVYFDLSIHFCDTKNHVGPAIFDFCYDLTLETSNDNRMQ